MLVPFLILLVPSLAGPTGRGSGGRTPLSGIEPLQVIERFYDIRPEFLLWWPFSNGFAF
jgi:hypothetical protein